MGTAPTGDLVHVEAAPAIVRQACEEGPGTRLYLVARRESGLEHHRTGYVHLATDEPAVYALMRSSTSRRSADLLTAAELDRTTVEGVKRRGDSCYRHPVTGEKVAPGRDRVVVARREG